MVEIDRDLAAALRDRFAPGLVVVHEGDALEFDLSALPEGLRVVGNLPYNVSTPLLFHVAAFAPRIRDCVFMLQKEVVDRMVADPGTPDYGRLSVMLQYRFAMALAFRVPPGAFTPPPKVDSAIVRMEPLRRGPPHRARRGPLHGDRRGRLLAAPQDAAQRGARPRGRGGVRPRGRRSAAPRGDALGRRVHRARRRGRGGFPRLRGAGR